mmetsp:Transcript_3807/g.10484  ORF Transcript_3807/g.10484 Transcript_3807/m.10484 type:complete len:232 (+) Transcript_3807:598-1293(+)
MRDPAMDPLRSRTKMASTGISWASNRGNTDTIPATLPLAVLSKKAGRFCGSSTTIWITTSRSMHTCSALNSTFARRLSPSSITEDISCDGEVTAEMLEIIMADRLSLSRYIAPRDSSGCAAESSGSSRDGGQYRGATIVGRRKRFANSSDLSSATYVILTWTAPLPGILPTLTINTSGRCCSSRKAPSPAARAFLYKLAASFFSLASPTIRLPSTSASNPHTAARSSKGNR